MQCAPYMSLRVGGSKQVQGPQTLVGDPRQLKRPGAVVLATLKCC